MKKDTKPMILDEDVVEILTALKESTGITLENLRCGKKNKEYYFARMIFANYCISNFTLTAIAAYLHIKSHATIINQLRQFENDCKYTKEFQDMYAMVEKYLKEIKVVEEVIMEMVEVE